MADAPEPVEGFHQQRFLLGSVVLISIAFLWMISGFLMALFLAALTAAMTRPIYLWLVRAFRGREIPAAITLVLLVFFLVVGPAMALVGLVVGQAFQVTQSITPWVQHQIENPEEGAKLLAAIPFVNELLESDLFPDRGQLIESGGAAIKRVGSVLIDGAAAAGSLTASFFLQLFIMLYALFSFLYQGPRILDRILYLLPLGPDQEGQLLERFTSVTRATLRGSLLIGGLQGLLAGIAFWLAGVPAPAFWGTVMMVLSVIPGIGAPVIWIPAALWLFGTGETTPAILVSLWCALVVGTVDNFLRPRLVGSDAKMSDLMILLSTLGGIGLFGPLGFVTGPILAAIFMTSWDLYAVAFADYLPATRAEDE
jgi:predicted PurR-regulated permease PerM